MQHLFHFCLTGYGFLESTTLLNGQLSARLRVLLLPQYEDNTTHQSQPAHPSWLKGILDELSLHDSVQDELILDCVIDDREFVSIVHHLEKARQVGHKIMMSFRAGYTQFGFHHVGQTKSDPKHMVNLKGKLLNLHGWFKDGHWINTADYTMGNGSSSEEAA